MKKILKIEKHDKISLGSLEGSIESAIEYLKNIWVNLSVRVFYPDGRVES